MWTTFDAGTRLWVNESQEDLDDFSDEINCMYWLQVFAAPRIYQTLTRSPPREHILRLLDVYLRYARRRTRAFMAQYEPVPYDRREPLTVRLIELFNAWTPPELPREIVETARDLLRADGFAEPAEGWDNSEGPKDDLPIEDTLLWPEGVPALLKRQRPEGG